MNFEKDFAEKYGLVGEEDYWYHQQSNSWILKHDAVVRIAHQEGIHMEIAKVLDDSEDHKALLVKAWRHTTDGPQQAVTMVGECAVGQKGITAQYPWCLAQKRGEDRGVLRLIAPGGGLYSDVEAEEVRGGGADQRAVAAAEPRRQSRGHAPQGVPGGGSAPQQGGPGGHSPAPAPVDHVPDGLAVPEDKMHMVADGNATLGFGKHKMRTWNDLAADEEDRSYLEWVVRSCLAKKGTNFVIWSDRELSCLYYSQPQQASALGAAPDGAGMPGDPPF